MRLLLAALLLTGCATQSKLGTDLDALLTKYESEGFSGTVLVAKDDRVVLHKGYGFADRARGIRNDQETLYEIASLNKTFTAAAILQLEAQGKLRTTDLLSKHLGAFPAPKDQATIHHLATHMAGLVPEGSDTGPGEDRDHFIGMVKQLPAESVPGARYRYTNAGYSVLAAIIEKVSGVSYETYVRDNLFRDFYVRGQPTPRPMAFGYLGAPPAVVVPPPMVWGVRGAGGMIASTGALYRWFRWLQRNPDMKTMFEERPEEEGYAWHVARDDKSRRMIHKGGGMPQYASQIIHYPDDGILIIWISNDLQKRWRKDLNSGIAEIALR